MIEIIKGNLLEAKEKYIAHQVNSVSNQAGGLAYYLFQKFPYANIYKDRPYPYKATQRDLPGQCVIKGDGVKDRFLINMIAQFYPGTPVNVMHLLDGNLVREGYFNQCLHAICRIDNVESIAFPKNIGCGLAGGDWKNYLHMLESFAVRINDKQNVKVVIYDYEQP
jgi:O-acetyl-ADP-ribose deacetylase (regulator of RNase III)